jgi:hypothetical protein
MRPTITPVKPSMVWRLAFRVVTWVAAQVRSQRGLVRRVMPRNYALGNVP